LISLKTLRQPLAFLAAADALLQNATFPYVVCIATSFQGVKNQPPLVKTNRQNFFSDQEKVKSFNYFASQQANKTQQSRLPVRYG